MPYEPHPLETSGIVLSPSLLELTELLAKEAHEVWARQRVADGWRLGPERNDAKKEHPCLVPYEALSETEKQYDRNAALETLKAIIAWGYRIEEPSRPVNFDPSDSGDIDLMATQEPQQDLARMDLATLLGLWQARPQSWPRTVDVVRLLSERFVKLGEPLLAYDVLVEGLTRWPKDVRLRQLQALALARSGAPHRARKMLQDLERDGHVEEETLGILARTYKDLWTQAPTKPARLRYLRQAFETYARAFRLKHDAWTGVNAATMALALGQRQEAQTFARQVHQRCLEDLQSMKDQGQDPYWALATLGEAALVLGELGEAESWYGQAAEAAHGRYGDVAGTRRNAQMILKACGADPAWIDRCLHVPGVAVFAGHMVDQPGRLQPRFPAELEGKVRASIEERVDGLKVGWAYASAAAGSDIVFLEAMQARKIPTYVVLPYQQEQFRRESVERVPGGDWRARFERVLQQAHAVVLASEFPLAENPASFAYANHFFYGLAAIRAAQLHTRLIPMAVWDGKPGDGGGGTADNVHHWRARGHEVQIIDLTRLRGDANDLPAPRPARKRKKVPKASSRSRRFPLRTMAMLFADAVGFSRLKDNQIPLFVQHFLGAIGQRLKRFPHQPKLIATAGDGLYMVFASVRGAGLYALDLAELVGKLPLKTKGLPETMNLRIALHVGPVYTCTNPITHKLDYMGTHVNRAARIEPITPPGHVYGSQAFAALSVAEGVTEFTCDYVGQTPMAKGYGTFPTYHVRRRHFGV